MDLNQSGDSWPGRAMGTGTPAVPKPITFLGHQESITATWVETGQNITALFQKNNPFRTHPYVKRLLSVPKIRMCKYSKYNWKYIYQGLAEKLADATLLSFSST